MVQNYSDESSNAEALHSSDCNELKDLQNRLDNVETENLELRQRNHTLQEENDRLKVELNQIQKKWKIFERKSSVVGEEEEEERLVKFKLLLKMNENIGTDMKDSPVKDAHSDLLTLTERHEIPAKLYEQASSNFKKCRTGVEDRKATHLNILALHSAEMGNYEEAAKLLKDSIVIQKDKFGQFHPDLMASLSNLAIVYSKYGQFEEAEETGLEVLSMTQKMLGVDHVDVASHLSDLALFCQSQNKYEDELMYYHRALHIYEAQLGGSNVHVTYTKSLLANCLVRLEKIEEAEYFYKQILMEAYERCYGFVDDPPEIAKQQVDDEKIETNVANQVWFKRAKLNFPTISETLLNMYGLYLRATIL
uniref:Kinesin light chain n=1 Tax=Glossina brevipalpis TaxID=37001 RepID=A0A1A9X4D7_9MUSC